MTRVVLVLGLTALIACDWNPPRPHLDGTWRFRFDDMNNSELQCSIAAVDMAITQSGSSFTGVQIGTAERRCVRPVGEPFSVSFADDTLLGSIGQMTISFEFVRTPGSSVAWSTNSHSGSVSGNVMLGRAVWAGSSEGKELDGTFAAFRLPD